MTRRALRDRVSTFAFEAECDATIGIPTSLYFASAAEQPGTAWASLDAVHARCMERAALTSREWARLDDTRCRFTEDRLTLAGEVDAETIEDAVRDVFYLLAWSLANVYLDRRFGSYQPGARGALSGPRLPAVRLAIHEVPA
jgi:hypothetical protein